MIKKLVIVSLALIGSGLSADCKPREMWYVGHDAALKAKSARLTMRQAVLWQVLHPNGSITRNDGHVEHLKKVTYYRITHGGHKPLTK